MARKSPADLLPDELWALVLSKCLWPGAWQQVKPLLLWRPGAARSLQQSPVLLAQLLSFWPLHKIIGGDTARALATGGLLRAIGRGRADVAAVLLEQHGTGACAANLLAPLLVASQLGAVDIMQLLLGIAEAAQHRQRALYAACRAGQLGAIQLLVEHGADVHAEDERALIIACVEGRADAVELLVQTYGADIHAQNDKALVCALIGHQASTVRVLLQLGASFQGGEDHAFHMAVIDGNPGIVQVFLDAGVAVGAHGNAALFIAAYKGHESVVRLLLQHGARCRADREEMLLGHVIAAGHRNIAQLIADSRTPRTRAAARRLAALFQQ